MKSSFHILNILFLVAFFCLFGGGRYSLMGYIFISVYFFLCIITFPKEVAHSFFSKEALPLYIFILYLFITGNFHVIYPTSMLITIVPLLILKFQVAVIQKRSSFRKCQCLYIGGVFLIILYFIAQYIIFVSDNTMAARYLVSSAKDDNVIIGNGYGMPYGLCMLIPFLICVCKEKKTTGLQLLFTLIFVTVSIFLIVRASFTTAILLLTLGIVLVFISKWKLENRIVAIFVLFILAVPLFEYIPTIVSIINPDATILNDRFNEVRAIMQNSSAATEGDFGGRLDLTVRSIHTFTQNIIFGVGPDVGYNYYALWNAGVGSHCEWIDVFARYGLFASFFIWYLVKNRSTLAPVYVGTMTLFVILGFLNPVINTQIFLITFYVVPMSGFLLNKPENANKLLSSS